MEHIVVFLDFANIDSAARIYGHMEEDDSLLNYLSEGRVLQEAYAYVPVDPRNEHGMDGRIERLWASGFMVFAKIGTIVGNSYKCGFHVEMTMDVLRIAHTARPDIIVLCTGDGNFLPLVKEIRRMGIRVEVASFEHSISRKLATQASGFIRLDSYVTEKTENLPLLDTNQQVDELDDCSRSQPDKPLGEHPGDVD